MMAGLIRLAAALLLLGIASPAIAQDISISFGDQGSLAARSIQLIVLITLLSLVPGLAIILTVLGLNLLGDGLRDRLDPRLRRVRA